MSNDNRNERDTLMVLLNDVGDKWLASNDERSSIEAFADAILAAGYHTTPTNDDEAAWNEYRDGDRFTSVFAPDRDVDPDYWPRADFMAGRASVLPYPENKEHTP